MTRRRLLLVLAVAAPHRFERARRACVAGARHADAALETFS